MSDEETKGKRRINSTDSEEEKVKNIRSGLKKIKEGEKKENTTMDELKDMIRELIIEVKQNTEKLDELKKEAKAKEEIWNEEKKQMFGRIEALEERLEKQERDKKRNNIVINGLTPNSENLEKEVEEFLMKELNTSVTPNNVYQIKTKNAILHVAEFKNWKDKQSVMENKHKLRGKKQPIFIDNHLTKEEQRIQAHIRELAREEKSKNPMKRIKVGYQKIIMDGVTYKWDKERLGQDENTWGDPQQSTKNW